MAVTLQATDVYVLVAGGGTGGHVNPAIAIADALVARGHDKEQLRFVGSKRGLEADLVPAAGYKIDLLPGRGISRSLTPANVGAVLGLLVALVRAVALVNHYKPRVVVSVGGYAGAPCAIAAVLLRVPLVLAESNAVPGASNRLVARFAKASAVALPDTPLRRAVVTGNPVRPAIANLDRSPQAMSDARRSLGLPADKVVVAAFGGSLGATAINRGVFELVEIWAERSDVAIYHAVGRRDWNDETLSRPTDAGALTYIPVEYESRMELLFAAADVAVCRAGASTVAELAAVGMPSVLVPFPKATGDHQTANAKTLESAGAAILVPNSECNGDRLAEVLSPLIIDDARRTEMGRAAKSFAVPDAADRVAALAEAHARV